MRVRLGFVFVAVVAWLYAHQALAALITLGAAALALKVFAHG